MFTGIIETIGTITHLQHEGSNVHLTIASAIASQLRIDQSVSHNGVCLTVIAQSDTTHIVTAIRETLLRTTIGSWQLGDKVNLERCLRADSRIDGHFVQGHVDQVAVCTQINEVGGSWYFTFQFDNNNSPSVLIDKGSIAIDGTSLTVVQPTENTFSVAIIPYTYEHTVFSRYRVGSRVNIEFDVLGKYITALFNRQIREK